ncbi:MAG: hypothetical protein AB7D96_10615 [Arcobacteraceae bacterium]
MKTGTKVRVIKTKVRVKKEFERGFVVLEEGDILTVGNYVHKVAVWLKANGIIDLIRVSFDDINKYFEEIPQPNKQELKKAICDCLERVYNSEGMIESAKADAMRAIDEFVDTFDYLNSDISLTHSMVAGGIPEGFSDYAGGSSK